MRFESVVAGCMCRLKISRRFCLRPPEADPTERRDIERVIEHLDPRAAQVVRAIGLEGQSIAETGARMEMTEGAVRVMLHRSLKKLAELRERLIEI
ncbi:RNA polymerase sigma factor, sigma-70 family [Thioclava dalianensis]|uniref:sigma factor-like helix-turn-helix DNA-binding protein n=1 Tax=Thioclava dalianensis TaxID=1185766 RepID=UPI0008F65D29|nr:sigma factor-like helix-turn-helix DNA-binding protein [Thioclava dalianensis]SFN33761.1 RNA polymerase sigma factor, sigma-70 family [Thioclava dalianensis]